LTYLGAYNHGALGAGASGATRTVTGTLPSSVIFGNRYLHYLIDANSQVAETNENNNRSYRKLVINVRPDLRVSYLAVSPTSQIPGGALTVKYRLRNYGSSMVPNLFYTRLYYSADSTIKTSDTYLKQFSAKGVKAGAYYPASGNGVMSVTVPGAAAAGTRYVGAFTDYNNGVHEISNSNNTRAAAFSVKSNLLGNGAACKSAAQCKSKYCVDGVCCNNACGQSNKNDCRACSVKAGVSKNGTCAYLSAGKLCRAASGPCDKAETCTGKSHLCPGNSYKSAKTVCRKASGPCDLAEACTGKSPACPGNKYKSAKTTCRAAKDKECDLLEACTGKAATCPKDSYKPNNAPCSKGTCIKGLCVGKGQKDSGADSVADMAAGDGPAEASGGETAPTTDATGGEASTAGDYTPPPAERDGCSCRTGEGPAGGLALVLLMAALACLGRRRRRG